MAYLPSGFAVMSFLSVPAQSTGTALAVRNTRKDITVTRFLSLLLITTLLLLSSACGSEPPPQSSDPRAYVLEDAQEVKFHNYKAQLDAESVPFPIRIGLDNDAYKTYVEGITRVFDDDKIGKINQGISVESSQRLIHRL